MANMYRFISKLRLVSVVLFLSTSQYAAENQDNSRLKYLMMEINNQTNVFSSKDKINIVKGDIVKIKSAVLEDGSFPDVVNLVGFPNGNKSNPAEDRGYIINTATDLLKGWSEDKLGTRYSIDISHNNKNINKFTLNLLDPILLYVIANINGKESVLRPGEVSFIKESDDFEVMKIVSNLSPSDKTIRFKMDLELVGGKNIYSMNFIRHDRVFGKIELEIKPDSKK